MKIDRLIGIITTMQQKGKVTIPYLADKYEVSVRTISRDLDDICRAGIPIVSQQGTVGGVSIMEGFVLDTSVFTREELKAVFTGLGALESVEAAAGQGSLLLSDKMKAGDQGEREMTIDLASFHKGFFSGYIEILRKAVAQRRLVRFHYYYGRGEEDKVAEPYRIVFKWNDWYLFGYSVQRKDFRLYKLRRMWDLELLSQEYTPRSIPEEKLDLDRNLEDTFFVSAVYQPEEKYRLVEMYGPYSYTVQEDESLYIRWGFVSREFAMSWFLQSGSRVKILEPEDFRKEYVAELKKALEQYNMT